MERCWNCGSTNYINVESTESCPDCGIECDYWGGGANDTYHNASVEKHRRENPDYDDDRW